jgi:hypothetical protein
MNWKDKIVSAVGATLAAGAIGGGVTVANAQPTPGRRLRRLHRRWWPRNSRTVPNVPGESTRTTFRRATRTARRSRTIARPLHRPDLENASVTPER